MYWNCGEQFKGIRCAFPMHQRSLSLQNLAHGCQQTFNQSFKNERSNIYCPPPASCFPCKPTNQPCPKACNIDENYMARCTREHILLTLAQNAGERLKRHLREAKNQKSENKRENMKIKKGHINARIAGARLNEESSPPASPTSVSLLSSISNIFSYSNEDNLSYDAHTYDAPKSDVFLNYNEPSKELESDYGNTANIREEFDDYKAVHEDDIERGCESTDAEEVLNEYKISCEKFPCHEENSLNNEGNQPDSENSNWPKICYFFGSKDSYPSTCCKSIQCNLINACSCCKSKMNDLNRKGCCSKAVQCNDVNGACDDADVKTFKMAHRPETYNIMSGHLKCKKEKPLYCVKSDCKCPLNSSIAKDKERFGGGAEGSSLHTIKSMLLSKELSLIGEHNRSNICSTVFEDCLSELEQKRTFSHSSSTFNSWLSYKGNDRNHLRAKWWDQYFDILEDLLPIKKVYLREMCSNGNSNYYQCYDPCNYRCYTCCYPSNCANTMICVPKKSCCNHNKEREELCVRVPSCQRPAPVPVCCKKPSTICPLPISPKGESKSLLFSCPPLGFSKTSKTNKSKDAKTKGKNGKKKSDGDTESLSEKAEDGKKEMDDDSLLDEASKEGSLKSEDEEKALQKEFETSIPHKSQDELDTEEIEPNESNDKNGKSQNAFDFNNEIYRKQPSEYFSAADNGDDSDATLKASNAPFEQRSSAGLKTPAYERDEQDEEDAFVLIVPKRSYYRSNFEYESEKHYSSEEEEFNEPNKLAPFDINEENRRDDYTRSSRGFDSPQSRSYSHHQYEKEREERYSSEEDENGRDLGDETNWRQAPTPLEKNKFYTNDEDDYPKPSQRNEYEPHFDDQSPDLNTRDSNWNDSEYKRESRQNFNEGNNLENRLYKGEIDNVEYQRPSLRSRFGPIRRTTRRFSEYRMNRTEEDALDGDFLNEMIKNKVNFNDVVEKQSIPRRNTIDQSTQYDPESFFFNPNATQNYNEQKQKRDSKYYNQDGGRGSFRPSKIERSRMTNDDFFRMSVGKPNRMDEKVYNEPLPERTIYDDVNDEKYTFVRPTGRKSQTLTTEYLIDENGDLIQHKTVSTEEHEYNKVSSNKNQKLEDIRKDNGTFDSYKQSESAQLNPFQNDRKSLRQSVIITNESDEGKDKSNDERVEDSPQAKSSRVSVVAVLGKETPPRYSDNESRERRSKRDKRLNKMNSQEKFSTHSSRSTRRNSTSEKHPLRRLPNSEENRYNKFLNSELEKVGKKLKSTKKPNLSSPILSKEHKATSAKTSRLPEAKSSTMSFVAVLHNEIQLRNIEEGRGRKLDAKHDKPLNYTNSRERRDTQSKRGIIPNSMPAKRDLFRLPNDEEKRNSRFSNNKSKLKESETTKNSTIRKNTASSNLREFNSNPEKHSVKKSSSASMIMSKSYSGKRQNAGADEENVRNVSEYSITSPQERNITQSTRPSYRRYSRYREYESEAETEQSGGSDEMEFNRGGRRATSDSSRQSRRNTERYSRPTLNRKSLQLNDFDANKRDTLKADDNLRYSRNYEPEVERYSLKYIPDFEEINDQEPRNTRRYSKSNENRQSIRREFQSNATPDREEDVDLNRRSRQTTDRISRPSGNRGPSSSEGIDDNQQRYSSRINRHSDIEGENEMYQGVQRISNNVSLNDTDYDLRRPSGRNTEQYLRPSGIRNTLQNDDFDENYQRNTLRKSNNQRYSRNYELEKKRYSLKYSTDSERKSDDQQRYSGRMSHRESQWEADTEGGNEVEKSKNLMSNYTNADPAHLQDQSRQYIRQSGNRNTLQFNDANNQRDSLRKSDNQRYSRNYDSDTESIPNFEEINNQPSRYSRRYSRSSTERQNIREFQSNSPSDAESLSQARQPTEIYLQPNINRNVSPSEENNDNQQRYSSRMSQINRPINSISQRGIIEMKNQPERKQSFSANDPYFEETSDNQSSRRKGRSQLIKNREYVSDIQRQSWEETFEGESVQKRIPNNQTRRSNDFKIKNENQSKVTDNDSFTQQGRGDKEPKDGSDAHQPYSDTLNSEISNIPYFSNLSKGAKDEVLQGINSIKSYCSGLSPQRREMLLKNIDDLCPKGSKFKEIENYCNQLSKEQKESILKKLNKGKENSNETEEGASSSQVAKLRESLEKQGRLPRSDEFKTVNIEPSVRSENLNNGTVFTPNEVNDKDSHARNSQLPITSANRLEKQGLLPRSDEFKTVNIEPSVRSENLNNGTVFTPNEVNHKDSHARNSQLLIASANRSEVPFLQHLLEIFINCVLR